MNAYDQKMVMGREAIAERGIWTAKKRYVLNCWDIEGVRYKEPKLKIILNREVIYDNYYSQITE